MAGRGLVVVSIFLLAAADSWFIAAGAPTDGEVGEVGGYEYAPEDNIGEWVSLHLLQNWTICCISKQAMFIAFLTCTFLSAYLSV